MNELTNTVLVLGSGPCALEAARELLAGGSDVILAAADEGDRSDLSAAAPDGRRAAVLEGAVLTGCRGTVGNFSVSLAAGGRSIARQVGAIVVAEGDAAHPLHALYGLQLSERVLPLSRLEAAGDGEGLLREARTAVFISGVADESSAAVAGRVMAAAWRLQSQRGIQTFVLAGNLKVAAEGLEAL